MESSPLLAAVPNDETLFMDDDYLGVSSTSAQRVRRFLRVGGGDPIGYQLADEPIDDFIFGPPTRNPYDIRQEFYAPYPNDAALTAVNPPDNLIDSFGYFGRFDAIHSTDSSPMDSSAETSASSSPLLALENPFDFELSLAELTENLSENPSDDVDCCGFITPNNSSITVIESEMLRSPATFDFFENTVQTSECSYEIAGYSQHLQQQAGGGYCIEQNRPNNYSNLSFDVNNSNANDKPATSSSTRTAELIRRNLEICEQLSPLKRYQEMLQKQKNKPVGVQPQFLRRKFSLMNAFVADDGAGDRRKNSRKRSTASDASARPKHNVSVRRWQSEVWTKLRGLTRTTAAGVNPTARLRPMPAKFAQRPSAGGRNDAQDRARSPPPINVSLMPNDGDANGVIIFH